MSDVQKYANSKVANDQREQVTEALMRLSDFELCTMIHGHFETHRTLPDEKGMKDTVNRILNDRYGEAEIEWDEKEDLAFSYAQTRIRQTPLLEGSSSATEIVVKERLAGAHIRAVELCNWKNGDIQIKEMDVSLVKEAQSDNVYVFGTSGDGQEFKIGTLPPKFVKENPMNVDRCNAKLSLVDYSNDNMKNVAVSVAVDVDEMVSSEFELDLNADFDDFMDAIAGIDDEEAPPEL